MKSVGQRISHADFADNADLFFFTQIFPEFPPCLPHTPWARSFCPLPFPSAGDRWFRAVVLCLYNPQWFVFPLLWKSHRTSIYALTFIYEFQKAFGKTSICCYGLFQICKATQLMIQFVGAEIASNNPLRR